LIAERGNNAKVGSRSAHAPKEILVLIGIAGEHLAIRRDQIERQDVVAYGTMFAIR